MPTRRELLRFLGGVCAIGVLTPDELLAVSEATHRRMAGARGLGFFDAHQMHTVAAACDRIIPETDTPGAFVAECHRFAERIVADHYPAARQKRFTDGLADLDRRSSRAIQRLFIEAPGNAQDAVLTAVEADAIAAAAPAGSFWRDLKELTLIGFYTSRIGIEDELQVNFTPGAFDGCALIDRTSR